VDEKELAKFIWDTILTWGHPDDAGTVDNWVQHFLAKYFNAEFPNGV